ncbi:glycosyltransferase family 2 protein [Candidatus Roizmanbacteria bacterium]|nr:glycosyltransferase family 2 protein [Candidatus Roizmanbacteria bacterium]
MKEPTVSIIILNYNGKKWLEKCLPSWKKVKYKNKEIIVVNNGSTDDSAAFVKKNHPEVRLIEVHPNRGFAGGNNYGVHKAKGKYILIINNDTEVTSTVLEPMVELMEKDQSIGIIQPEMRNMVRTDCHDAVASFYTSTGFLYHYGYMQDIKKKQYNKQFYCYSIKGSCMFMRRDDYLKLGGLDEDFVCYVEESDLCHRVWLSGKKVIYYPKSLMYHFGGGDMSIMEKSETTVFRAFRNRFISYIKNLSTWELVKVLPIHFILAEGFILVMLLKGKFKNSFAAQKGVLWWLFNMRAIFKKRKYVQTKIRKVSDKEIMQYIKHNPPLNYYFHFFTNPEGKYNEPKI